MHNSRAALNLLLDKSDISLTTMASAAATQGKTIQIELCRANGKTFYLRSRHCLD